jgi:hypothetical protein
LPVPVTFTRFATALFVFIFGIDQALAASAHGAGKIGYSNRRRPHVNPPPAKISHSSSPLVASPGNLDILTWICYKLH